MSRVIILATTTLVGWMLIMLSQGDASNPVSFSIYAMGSFLAFGAVGLFCLSARPLRSGRFGPETILFALLLVSNLLMLVTIRAGVVNVQVLDFLRFLPGFFYFSLLSLTAHTLSRLTPSGFAMLWKIGQLILFPFFAASLERDRIQVSAGRLGI